MAHITSFRDRAREALNLAAERDGLAREVREARIARDSGAWCLADDIRAANEAQGWPSGGEK